MVSSASADTWTQQANFGGSARHAATGFYLNGKGYIGTGGTFSVRKKDFWQWDPVGNVWSQKADFGGTARSGAVGFAIGNLGYIATGFSTVYCKDIYAYDPTTNTWTQKANLPAAARHYAVGFSLDGKGYIGTGNAGGAFKDFWQYDPVADSWTQKADFGGTARSSSSGFGLNGKGYLGIGYGSGPLKDFWEYDPVADTWTKKADFGGGKRSDGVAFAICDKGFMGAGVASSVDKNDLWEYDPVNNTWTQKSNFGGQGRENAVGFSDGTYGYIGTGTNIFNEFSDFYQYTSDCLILPISLTDFTAAQKEHTVVLSWTTASEINNDFFSVEKSLDGVHFQTFAVVKGNGNSTAALHYQAIDMHPFTGLNYYRLKQTDFDGNFSYSLVISCRTTGIGMMQILSVNPNPVQSVLDITTDLSDEEELEIMLFTTKGQLVSQSNFVVDQDIQHVYLNVDDLHQGMYLLAIDCEYGSYTQKVIKTN